MDEWDSQWENPSQPAKIQPNREAIRQHIEWHIAPARGAYDDALFEIALDRKNDGIKEARLFGLDEVDEAVEYAASENVQERNAYLGATLKMPDTPRNKRTDAGDFYVGTAVPVDIDEDYDEVRKLMAGLVEDGFTVITGTTPSRRSQHWVRAVEPCEDPDLYTEAFAGLVCAVGADLKVKDSARVMRLGGTISWPSERKKNKGYQVELTRIAQNDSARPISVERLAALPPLERLRDLREGVTRDPTGRNNDGEIVRDGMNLIVDGRELYFRNTTFALMCKYQNEFGADPTVDDIFENAYAIYRAKCYDPNGDWPRDVLYRRCENTIRRLMRDVLPVKSIAGGKWQPKQTDDYDWGISIENLTKIDSGEPKITAATQIDGLKVKHPTKPPVIKSSSEWVAGYMPPKYLISGILQSAYVYALTARSGHGKSAVALLLAACVALGILFAGNRTKKGRVLFCAAENPSDITLRTAVLYEHLGVKADEIEIDYIGAPFGIDEHLALIREHSEKVGGYSLIILDTLQAFFRSDDDNDNMAMVRFAEEQLRPMTELPGNPAILVLAHPNKTAGKDDLVPRGGSGFLGAIDGNITLWRKPGTSLIEVKPHGEKFRGAPFDPINFELKQVFSEVLKDADGEPAKSVLPVAITDTDMEIKITQALNEENKMLVVMDKMFKRNGSWPTIRDLTTQGGFGSKSAVHRALNDLKESKLISQIRSKGPYQITAAGFKELEDIYHKRDEEFEIDV